MGQDGVDWGVPVCFFCFPKKLFESVQVGRPLREQVVVRGAHLLPIFNNGQDAGRLASSPLTVLLWELWGLHNQGERVQLQGLGVTAILCTSQAAKATPSPPPRS